jgi:hypothetical protein
LFFPVANSDLANLMDERAHSLGIAEIMGEPLLVFIGMCFCFLLVRDIFDS